MVTPMLPNVAQLHDGAESTPNVQEFLAQAVVAEVAVHLQVECTRTSASGAEFQQSSLECCVVLDVHDPLPKRRIFHYSDRRVQKPE